MIVGDTQAGQLERDATPYTVTLDDDILQGALIERATGMTTLTFTTASELVAQLGSLHPRAVFVDVHLAVDENGLDYIPVIKERLPHTPVIVMTADDSDEMIQEALASGAEDFIRKPLRVGEVRARLQTRLKEKEVSTSTQICQFEDISLDPKYGMLVGGKGKISLSKREAELLELLIRSQGAAVSRRLIKRSLWGGISVSDNALDRKLYEVRRSLKLVSDQVQIKTLYGKGFRLAHPRDVTPEPVRS